MGDKKQAMKTCSVCGNERPAEDFVKDRRKKSGYSSECLLCKRARASREYQDYKRRNPDRVRASNAKVKEKNRDYQKRIYRELKIEVINAYGGVCVCCGEKNIAFLTIDHVFNDGRIHRSAGEKHSGVNIYRLLKKEGFPKERYQVLCYNCNCAKQHDPEGHRLAHPNAILLERHEEKSLA